jgi:aminoglycoside phosphotransferase (APT) family kinase protein
MWFPDDPALPALPAAVRPSAQVRRAVLAGLGLPANLPVRATAVRYKPGERCVIRYDVEDDRSGQVLAAAFGKVLPQAEAAARLDAVQHALVAEPPIVPFPVGLVPELGLTLSRAAGPGWRPGTRVLVQSGRTAGDDQDLCGDLTATGTLLARLHAVPLTALTCEPPVRAVADDLRALASRAAALRASCPAASRAADLAEPLAERLLGSAPDPASHVLTHGAFKPSQLLFGPPAQSGSAGGAATDLSGPIVTDLDGVAAGEAARDLGYLLAYLRPHQLTSGRAGQAAFVAHAARSTLVARAYSRVRFMGTQPGPASDPVQLLARARLYEAAILYKIAHRRVNRLQSARPRELQGLADQVAALLGEAR